jgi:hypothetical protein
MGQLLRMSGLVAHGLIVETTAWSEEGLLIAARPSAATGRSPECGMNSDGVHSRYERGLADLPISGRRARLNGPALALLRGDVCAADLRRALRSRCLGARGPVGPLASIISSIISRWLWAAGRPQASRAGLD